MGECSIPISVLLFPFCDFAKILLPSSPVCFRMEFILSAELANQVHREGRNHRKRKQEQRELHCQEDWAAGTQGAGCEVSLASPRMHQEVREEGRNLPFPQSRAEQGQGTMVDKVLLN